jgi:hypothetical protein
MSKPLTTEDRICILLTMIFDEGVDEYPQNFRKLFMRLNEYYDTNKVDIINYFTKVIMYIPSKGTIYANALHNFGKVDIINNIFKKLAEELNKNKNSFIFIRSFIFIFGLIHFGVIANENLIHFIQENIAKKNTNLLKIILRSIFLLFRKNNEYQFLQQSINIIYESDIIDKNDLILNVLHKYANNDIDINKSDNKFDGFFIKDINLNNETKSGDNNDVNMIDSNTNNNINKISGVDNIFNELNNINYEKIFCPELISRKFIDNKENNSTTFLDIYYELFLMNNIDAFKDEPTEGTKLYLFNIPGIYYNIKEKEENNGINPYQFFIDNFTYASLDLVLYPFWKKSDLCYIVKYIIFVLSEKKSWFKILIEENNEQNIYINFINSVLSNINLLQNLSPFQLNNLIFFLYQIISNISDTKIEIFSQMKQLTNYANNSSSILYFQNSFYEKMTNLIKKDESNNNDIYFPEKDLNPMKNDAHNLPFFDEISSKVNRAEPFNSFDKTLFEKDEQNEALYTFVYCILYQKNNSLNRIYDNIELYESALREIINNNNNNSERENDKMKTVLKVIFDLYGHLPLYYIYIIDLFAFKNLLNHITIINFIFTEKLFQKKENGTNYGLYELINNCVDNCYSMLTKFDNDFQNLVKGFQKVGETQRTEMQLKMDFYDKEVDKLKKQSYIICDKILEMFIKMYEMSEGLGGAEYKLFIKKVIKDEHALFYYNYNVSDEWTQKIKNLE